MQSLGFRARFEVGLASEVPEATGAKVPVELNPLF